MNQTTSESPYVPSQRTGAIHGGDMASACGGVYQGKRKYQASPRSHSTPTAKTATRPARSSSGSFRVSATRLAKRPKYAAIRPNRGMARKPNTAQSQYMVARL